MKADVLVVGSGLAGSTAAERLAGKGFHVVVVEKRPHIGGNAHDDVDANGVLIHRYGPHVFHTDEAVVFDYLSQFTDWQPYEHRVLASVGGRLFPFPVNLDTLNRFFNLNLDENEAEEFLRSIRAEPPEIRTSEDVVLSRVGREICDAFFRGYTRKQWGLDLSEIDAEVANRIPVRTNRDDRYFTDRFQYMPKPGFTRMIERMLDHPRIEVIRNIDYLKHRGEFKQKHIVFTGPIDAYFDFTYGKLPYRSIRFDFIHYPEIRRHQAAPVINYPNDHAFTRVTEYKLLTFQTHPGTTIGFEYPGTEGEPCYPIPNSHHHSLYLKYATLASKERSVTFLGRLAEYRYYNMDQVVLRALVRADQISAALR